MSKTITRKQIIEILKLKAEGLLQSKATNSNSCKAGQINAVVGMVGYPNVGKSSVINTLLGVTKSNHGKVRVGVSSTPGKTKHFQTITLSSEITICDCPGLVFPSFMDTTGEMLCSGILPINQMRNCMEPASIIASRIPQHLLEATYGIKIIRLLDFLDNPDRPPTGEEFLAAYCKVKGYITSKTGRWDEFRACKEILRDFNDGVLLYVAIPPIEEAEIKLRWIHETEQTASKWHKVSERLRGLKLSAATSTTATSLGNHVSKSEKVQETIDNEINVSYEFIDAEEQLTLDPGDISDPTVEGSKREHKRLKHWGKKNRKLRDKTPYDESHGPQAYGAFFTNRNLAVQASSVVQSKR